MEIEIEVESNTQLLLLLGRSGAVDEAKSVRCRCCRASAARMDQDILAPSIAEADV